MQHGDKIHEDPSVCMCGHYQHQHKDTDYGLEYWRGWGEGECTICGCERFMCRQCDSPKIMESNATRR